MNRKNFLSSMLPLGAVLTSMARGRFVPNDTNSLKIPPSLKKGDIIGICCTAGYITQEEVQPAVQKLREWGFEVTLGATVGERDATFGGTDQQRLNDFQHMLDDPEIRAILCARGGYGTIRIIDKINFSRFVAQPKWVIGFSDVTVLHCHINRNFGIATLHSKMCNSFPDDWNLTGAEQRTSIESIYQGLTGKHMRYLVAGQASNRTGAGEGILIGGNLRTIETLAGSVSDIRTDGKILFVEDKDEYLYSIDRMFWSLKRAGKLSNLQGLIIGGFKATPDDPGDAFGKTLEAIVLEKVAAYSYPVCFGFPVGHQPYNMALKCGVLHQLTVTTTLSTLTETR